MIFGSVCSGMEAASLAWKPLGWQCAFVSEIDAAPCELLAQRFPGVPNYGDLTKFESWPDVAIDVLVGGTPCQSFSVAGLRGGLADPRGALMLAFGALAARYRPRWIVWENVPGVLSSNEGRDFGGLLGLLSGQSIEPPADGWQNSGVVAGHPSAYGLAWAVLDAQFFDLAQRRARVFVVGHLGDWRPPAAVLFERESLRGDSAPRREAGERPAPTIRARTKGGGGLGTDFDCDGGLISHALLGKPSDSQVPTRQTYLAHSLRADGFDASEDGTGRGTPLVPVAFALRGREGGAVPEVEGDGDKVGALRAANGGSSRDYIAFSCKDHGADAADDLAPTMRAMGHDGSHANAGGQLAVAHAFDARQSDVIQYGDKTGPLDTDGQTIGVQSGWAVRRLTPVECERLQGAPDDWTNITRKGKPIADGPRYKMLGNSMAVPVMRWLGERINFVSSIQRDAA